MFDADRQQTAFSIRNKTAPKYSIIIPARNGGSYIHTCLKTILQQSYTDYEVILSDDHSTDGSTESLRALNHPNLKILEPPPGLSMTEHWEWALSHARGEWQIFVGQDDGLQSYFFDLADHLTKLADQARVRTIMSERAYYFWKGCEFIYGDVAVNYSARPIAKLVKFRWKTLQILAGAEQYFELPEMYTTSLFHCSLLAEARSKQNGKVFTAHPQDANLGAISSSLEQKYLYSGIPLGWVGTSPKSAGMAVSAASKLDPIDAEQAPGINSLQTEYTEKIKKSSLPYHKYAGDFLFGSMILYFWQALLQTANLRARRINAILQSKIFRMLLLGFVRREMRETRKLDQEKMKLMFHEIIRTNECSPKSVIFAYYLAEASFGLAFAPRILLKAIRKLRKLLSKNRIERVVKSSTSDADLLAESNQIAQKIRANAWIESLTL